MIMMSLIIRNQLDNKKRENENKQIKVQDKPSRNLSCDLFKHLLTKKRCKICRKVFNKEGENNYQAHYAKCKTLKEQKETLKKMIDDLRQTNNELNLLEALNLRNKKNRNSSYSNKVKVNKEATILSFEDKVKMLRMYIRELKIDWRQGYDSIIVDRSEIIYQSFKQFHTINPYKELKISFKGENSQDAGGLLREWLTVLFQQFLNDKLKMFQRANTDDISYIIKTNQNRNPGRTNLYYFIGQLIAKALLENITINCCFNKILYKLILEESIEYEDLIFIDKLLFHSLNKIFDYEKIEELELYYTVQYEASDGSIVTKELIEGGEDIQVTNENIEDYISLRVERIVYYQKMFVNEIKNGLYEIIPKKMLKQFTCDEFELILNGTPFIDLEDWRTHTTYIDYKNTDLIIIEFWKILLSLDQNELSHILQFCTGNTKVPIGGFASLESNRGNKAPFCITKCNYYQNETNYIKAHTCFNRLDLPNYPSKSLLKNSIYFLLQNEALGFGIV